MYSNRFSLRTLLFKQTPLGLRFSTHTKNHADIRNCLCDNDCEVILNVNYGGHYLKFYNIKPIFKVNLYNIVKNFGTSLQQAMTHQDTLLTTQVITRQDTQLEKSTEPRSSVHKLLFNMQPNLFLFICLIGSSICK